MKSTFFLKSLMTGCSVILLCSATMASPPVRQTGFRKHLQVQDSVKRTNQINPGPLVADNITPGARLKNKAANAVEKMTATREELENPAEDIYGDNSWTSHVNPFAGRSVTIPSSKVIDLSGFHFPLDRSQVTSQFGYRRRFRRMHYGTDLHLRKGDPVRAAFDGKVRICGYEAHGYGNYIVIRHPNGLETIYGHLSKGLVHENQIVHAGELIGLGGSTGRSTGPHLHFEMRFMGIPINPQNIIDMATRAPYDDTYTFRGGAMAKSTQEISFPKGKRRMQARGKSRKRGTRNRTLTHRIKKGDTLCKIASRYGVTVASIKKLNPHIKANNLREMTAIRIK